MIDTKNRILETALKLFAQYGYRSTSMSDIAEGIGITKGALYRHYSGKQAILDAIINRMQMQDASQAQSCSVPEAALNEDVQAYRHTGMQQIFQFAMEQFRYWTRDEFAAAFRRLLALERYHNPDLMELYQCYLCSGPLEYMRDLFREMEPKGNWTCDDAEAMALEFYGPMYMLMDAADAWGSDAAMAQLRVYLDGFIEKYMK